MLRIINSKETGVQDLLRKVHGVDESLINSVRQIVEDVRINGEAAVFHYTRRFDGAELSAATWQVTEAELEEACRQVEEEFLAALRRAKANIISFHQKQLQKSWWETDSKGNITGQIYRPVERVGIYVPGGTAAYPSSVLMTALPAVVAGVKEIIMTSPPNADGTMNPYTLVAAKEAGVTAVYKAGGAQAIAALAYGTENLRPVQKIVGPGNIFVTLAKKMVYGQVDIDMLAGPSEILVIADETARPEFVAADLLSQAEHDPLASAILLTPSQELAQAVRGEVEVQLEMLPRKEIARKSIDSASGIIVTEDLEEALALANEFAPEHLELAVEDPFRWLGKIRNAGAIFLGHFSPEPLGDYFAGPNHVLPTGGTAKFYSPLNVDIYMKKSSLIVYSRQGLEAASQDIIKLASVEGLDAHANAIRVRVAEEC
ncbi:histidinol dehydrogenase [Zhaonella formicivorans]|uniref:histidinol dehydrogenase n=1 Tax=Zhaonella formicivorans TaxID=2528593 RepID=UPI0010E7012C|nr:histidinol dehydrogenase [Zhaonella formicivorans]